MSYRERRQPRAQCPYCLRSQFVGYLPKHIEKCNSRKEATVMGMRDKKVSVTDMIQVVHHHDSCQAALEAAAAMITMMVEDDIAFARMLDLHREIFPEDEADKLRDAYQAVIPMLLHISNKHENGMRNKALSKIGINATVLRFNIPREVIDIARGMMPTLFDDPDTVPESAPETPESPKEV